MFKLVHHEAQTLMRGQYCFDEVPTLVVTILTRTTQSQHSSNVSYRKMSETVSQ